MNIILNGSEQTLGDRATVADAVRAAQAPTDRVAVAVNGQVVRRADWETATLADGDRVEIVAAIQGG
jgi:sulfur carrier protein